MRAKKEKDSSSVYCFSWTHLCLACGVSFGSRQYSLGSPKEQENSKYALRECIHLSPSFPPQAAVWAYGGNGGLCACGARHTPHTSRDRLLLFHRHSFFFFCFPSLFHFILPFPFSLPLPLTVTTTSTLLPSSFYTAHPHAHKYRFSAWARCRKHGFIPYFFFFANKKKGKERRALSSFFFFTLLPSR